MFLLKIERVERPHCGLTTTEGSQTVSLCYRAIWPPRAVGLTASLCIAHGLTTTEAGQTANTSSGQFLNLKVVCNCDGLTMIWTAVWPSSA
jgi:hypothetical protein